MRMWNIIIAGLGLAICGVASAAPIRPPDPVSLWLFDDGSGTAVTDAQSGRHGTLQNPDGDEWTTADLKFDYPGDAALKFDPDLAVEVTDHVTAPDFDYYDDTAGFAASFWFKVTEAANVGRVYQYMFSHNYVNEANAVSVYMVGITGEIRMYVRDYDDPSTSYANTTGRYDDGQWHLATLVATWDDDSGGEVTTGGVELFVDGASGAYLENVADDPFDPEGQIYFGMREDNQDERRLNGWMDEVAIWNQALTQDHIDWLWNNGDGNTLHETTPVPEPGSFAVVALGLAGVMALKRRR